MRHYGRASALRVSVPVDQGCRLRPGANRLLPRIVSPFVAFQDADDWSVPVYGCLERSESLTQSPSTGFDSDLRRTYRARFRRRFYANLLRHWTGTLAVRHLQAPPNDVDFHLNDLENGQRAA